jgi:pimeloyl-ACP methyl ester carboxylesterase
VSSNLFKPPALAGTAATIPESLLHQPQSGPPLSLERYDAASPAALLIHGGGDGAFIWDAFAPILAKRFTTLAVDLRGHGNSGWDSSGRYGISDYLADLASMLDHARLDEIVLIGHSLGGLLATHLAARYQQMVRACVLVDFAPQMNHEGLVQAGTLLKQSLRFYPTIAEYADWLKQTRWLTEPATLERMALRALRPDGVGFRLKLDPAIPDSFHAIDLQEAEMLWTLLRRQHCPTLVVRGSGSAVLTPASARRVSETLPRGILKTIDAAGHAVMLDNPVEFGHAVLTFLEDALR